MPREGSAPRYVSGALAVVCVPLCVPLAAGGLPRVHEKASRGIVRSESGSGSVSISEMLPEGRQHLVEPGLSVL